MKYDLIIVSKSDDPELIQMTKNCIDSARQDGAELNIIVIETGKYYQYEADLIFEYNGDFNYNRALNKGLTFATGDVHILANNDIIFHEGWSVIGSLMESNGYHSASALSQDSKGLKRGYYVYEGYEIGKHLTGWCIFMDAFCRETIGPLDESCNFWYSDNLYACQLKASGLKHGIFCNIQVDHITSRTLIKQSSAIQRRYQTGELMKFKIREKYYATNQRNDKVHPANLQT
jgi:hypothetical protein